jgi:hypothetical protein
VKILSALLCLIQPSEKLAFATCALKAQPKIRSFNTILSLVRQGIWSSEQYHLPAMQEQAK